MSRCKVCNCYDDVVVCCECYESKVSELEAVLAAAREDVAETNDDYFDEAYARKALEAEVARLREAAQYARDVLEDVTEGEWLPVTPEIAMNKLDAALAPAERKEERDG